MHRALLTRNIFPAKCLVVAVGEKPHSGLSYHWEKTLLRYDTIPYNSKACTEKLRVFSLIQGTEPKHITRITTWKVL